MDASLLTLVVATILLLAGMFIYTSAPRMTAFLIAVAAVLCTVIGMPFLACMLLIVDVIVVASS